MSVTYNDGVELAKVSLREDRNRLNPNDWKLIAQQAVLHFSKDRPRKVIADITGNGTKIYTLSGVVASWGNRFSKFKKIEFPTNSDPKSYIQSDNYEIYESATDTEQLVFKDVSPSATQTIRATYTVVHTFNDTTSTIDDQDKIMFCLLMAHYAAQALVSDFLKANRSNLPNDSVDFSQKSKDMQALADALLKKYAELVSGKTEAVKSYGTFVKDYDMKSRYKTKYGTVPEGSR